MNILLNTPAGVDIELLPPEQAEAIRSVSGEWPPGGRAPGTVEANGRQLTHAQAQASLEQIEQLIAVFALDWQILAAQDMDAGYVQVGEDELGNPVYELRGVHKALDPADVLPYLPDIVTEYDADGNPAVVRPVTEQDLRDGVLGLHIYSGHAPWYIP